MTMNKIEKLIKQILNKDVDTKIVTHILDVIERDPRKNEYALTARKNIRLRLELAEKKLSADYPIWLELIKRTYQIRAYDKFDDYLLFLEWDRQPEKQFYLPRRAVLKKIVDEMQDLEDGKFEILSVSLPPRTGKFLKNSTPILTKNGWKNHGDLVIGDEVLNHKGEFVKVQHVFPKSSGDIRVWFTDGTYLDTHENHEWVMWDGSIKETKDLKFNDKLIDTIFNQRNYVLKIEKRAPEEGNCIQVEGGIYLAGKTLKPTHNSTLGVFFITWTMGRNPDKANVMSGHSDKLTDGFFREALNVISDADTYNWAKVFPNNRVERVNAKDEIIDLNNFKRFPTLTCRSVEGTLTGAVEVGNILYCDDLVSDLEEALNPSRLQSKWEAYVNQLKDRKKLGAKEIHVATRWSVADPIGRIKELYANDPRYREIIIPALDENEKSNFNYPFEVGFDEEYYYDMRKTTDAATWSAKYLGQPYEREGLLFPADDLKYFNGTLPPEKSLVKIFAFCDVAWGGGDYVSMPIAYEYEDGAIYIPDVVFSNGDRNVSQPIVAGKLKHHRPSETEFEANNGGQEYAYNIDDMLKADGINLNINHRNKPATKSKLSRIIEESPNIREVYFLDQKNRTPEYEAFMQNLTSFVQTGKVKNDDAPDSMSGLMKIRKTVSREIKIFNRF